MIPICVDCNRDWKNAGLNAKDFLLVQGCLPEQQQQTDQEIARRFVDEATNKQEEINRITRDLLVLKVQTVSVCNRGSSLDTHTTCFLCTAAEVV